MLTTFHDTFHSPASHTGRVRVRTHTHNEPTSRIFFGLVRSRDWFSFFLWHFHLLFIYFKMPLSNQPLFWPSSRTIKSVISRRRHRIRHPETPLARINDSFKSTITNGIGFAHRRKSQLKIACRTNVPGSLYSLWDIWYAVNSIFYWPNETICSVKSAGQSRTAVACLAFAAGAIRGKKN